MTARASDHGTLVGRGGELAALGRRLRGLDNGTGAAVWLEGGPGIGKSAVVDAVLSRCWYPTVSCDRHGPVPLGLSRERLEPGSPECPASTADPIDQVEAAVAARCAVGPLVLVAEDLHDADDQSLLAWNRLARAAGRLPLLLISTCRPRPYRERVSQLRELVRLHSGDVIELKPLADADLVAVARRWLGGAPGHRLARYLRALNGNPGHARDLLAALEAEALLSRTAGRTDLVGTTTRADALLEQYACADLTDPERRALRLASLLGPRFDAAELAAAATLAPPTVAAALSAAVEYGILRVDGEHLSFRHGVLRDACAATFSGTERALFHHDSALRLLASGAAPVTVAWHLRAAGELPTRAAQWLARLPESTLLAEPELFAGVLRLVPADPRRPTVDYWLGRYDAAAQAALDLVPRADDPQAALRLAVRALIRAGRHADAAELCAGASESRLVAWHAIALAANGDLAAARDRIRGLTTAQADPEADATVAHALTRLGRGAPVTGTLAAARDALGSGSESIELRVMLHADLIELLAQTGPADALLNALAELPLVLAGADARLAAWLRGTAGWAWYVAGRWDQPAGWDRAVSWLIAARRSRLSLDRTIRGTTPVHKETAAILTEQAGRTDEALRLRRDAFVAALSARPTRLHGVEHLVRLALAVGAPAADVVDDCERVAADEGLPTQLALAGLVRAMLDADVDGLLGAADRLRDHGAVLQQAYGMEEAAVCFAGRGDRAAAGRALREAVQIYASVGASWDIARADERLRGFGIHRRTPADQPVSGWAALTPAEFRVVRLVARGLSNRDVAAELFLSQNTVQTHLARIRDKLGLRSRLEIARAAGFQAESPGPAQIRSRRPGAGRG